MKFTKSDELFLLLFLLPFSLSLGSRLNLFFNIYIFVDLIAIRFIGCLGLHWSLGLLAVCFYPLPIAGLYRSTIIFVNSVYFYI